MTYHRFTWQDDYADVCIVVAVSKSKRCKILKYCARRGYPYAEVGEYIPRKVYRRFCDDERLDHKVMDYGDYVLDCI